MHDVLMLSISLSLNIFFHMPVNDWPCWQWADLFPYIFNNGYKYGTHITSKTTYAVGSVGSRSKMVYEVAI